MRLVTSDWHIVDGSAAEPCDRQLVRRVVETAIERQVDEVIGAGDLADFTRGGRGCLPAAAKALGELVGGPLGEAGIPFTYIAGNHDWFREWMTDWARLLVQAGFKPSLFVLSTGPELRGGRVIEHGHRFDPTCEHPGSGFGTRLGEAFTRIDWWADRIGLDLEPLNFTRWEQDAAEVPSLDYSVHQAMHRWAARTGAHLVVGHSHDASEVAGRWRGHDWSVLHTGACTKGSPFAFAWIKDCGQGGVEIEFSEERRASC